MLDEIDVTIPILCVLVAGPDGECWEPLKDYLRNPPVNTYIIRLKKPGRPEDIYKHPGVFGL